jgi:hypothetical protein
VGKLTQIPVVPFASPNDPLGRTVDSTIGNLQSIGTSILTSVGPGPTPGTLGATTRQVFVFNEDDQLTAAGVAVFTPIPGTPNVNTALILTVTGGIGKYAAATGTILANGTTFDFFPLPPGPSTANQTISVLKLDGSVCGIQ